MFFFLFNCFNEKQMDVGVGSFMLCNALVHKQTKRKSLMALLLKVSPLLFLGFVRLAMVKGSDYQVEPSLPLFVVMLWCVV